MISEILDRGITDPKEVVHIFSETFQDFVPEAAEVAKKEKVLRRRSMNAKA